MNPFLAPPTILSAMSFEADQDSYLRRGIHLRIFAGMGASFPVTPFFVYKVKGRPSPPNEGGRVQLASHAGQRHPSGAIDTFGRTPVRLTFTPVQGDIRSISMQDGVRTIATRSRDPWTFSLPDWRWVTVVGDAHQLFATSLDAPDDVLSHGEIGERIRRGLALPGEPGGPFAWYVGWERNAEKQKRVGEGWPQVWGPREQHTFSRWKLNTSGSFDPLPVVVNNPAPTPGNEADEELARVEHVLSYVPRVDDVVDRMLKTGASAPWAQAASFDVGGKEKAEVNPLQMLQLAMADYGMARHFGYASCWPDGQVRLQDDEMLAIFTLVAFDPTRIPEADPGMLQYTIQRQRQSQTSSEIERMILRAIADDRLSPDPEGELQRVKDLSSKLGLMVAPFVAYTAPVAPYDPPTLSAPQVVRRQWALPESRRKPSDKYSAVFAFRDTPMCALALLERETAGDWSPRSGSSQDDEADGYKHWLKPAVFGREREQSSRAKELKQAVTDPIGAAVLSDQAIDAAASTNFRASASDVFGRFGAPVSFVAGAPSPRPKPSAPTLNYLYEKVVPTPAGTADASPGKIKLTARFDADNANVAQVTEIAVPSVAALPRGALEIAALELTLSGTLEKFGDAVQVNLPAQPAVTLTRNNSSVDIPVPALPPMGRARLKLTGAFVDTAGTRSEETAVEMTVTDGRAPQPLNTGVGLLWTTRPSPAPEVSIDLVWQAVPGSEHVVYLGDERTLMPSLGQSAPRGARGATLCDNSKDHAPSKYQRVTQTPLKASAAGVVSYTLNLPRTLESVQVVRVVPLGPDGAEPPFKDCATVPVAVPSSRRAAPPLLVGDVDGATGKPTLTIVADGLHIDELRAEQPGLFDPAKQGKELPAFRVRSSRGKVAHPIYAQVRGAGQGGAGDDGALPLQLKTEQVQGTTRLWFEGSLEGAPLAPYVRHVYWAETRLPPERCLPADKIQKPSGVGALHAESTKPAPRLWGEPSAPLVLMFAPPAAPLSPADVGLQITDNGPPKVKLTLTLADPPKRVSYAIDTFKLAAWYRWGDSSLSPALDAAGASLDGRWPEATEALELMIDEAPSPGLELRLHVALIDPIGRLGPVTVVTA